MESILNAIALGEVTAITIAIYIVLALIVSAIGGAIGGILIGGKDLGIELAAMMGSFYGPLATVPGILIALIILTFI